jgi:DNA-3-methyladenine glycosylase II
MTTDIATLKSAGLSTRKAEYGTFCPSSSLLVLTNDTVQSLAEHFDSGHLSAEFMASASDEEVGKRLIAVRGIGQVGPSPSHRMRH